MKNGQDLGRELSTARTLELIEVNND